MITVKDTFDVNCLRWKERDSEKLTAKVADQEFRIRRKEGRKREKERERERERKRERMRDYHHKWLG